MQGALFPVDVAISDMYPGPIVGIDEAGRGPLCGPVVAAAVVIPDGLVLEGLDDSKKLSLKKREALYEIIIKECMVGVSFVDEKKIDEINILQATYLAMTQALKQLDAKNYRTVLIDGNSVPLGINNAYAIVGGDGKVPAIAAASVVAKVSRDRYMHGIHLKLPQYNWLKNKGYATAEHRNSILEFGPCEHHRRSFIKKLCNTKVHF
jgi:ribonuclease HII